MLEQNPFNQPPQTPLQPGLAPPAEILSTPENNLRLQNSADFAGSVAVSSEINEMTPANQLGVVDGKFKVHRSDGSIEEGWNVRHSAWKDKRNGNILVTIDKPDPEEEGTFLVKDIPMSEFASWQLPESVEDNNNVALNFDNQPYDNEFPVGSSNFEVTRSDGTIEGGWKVTRLAPGTGPGKNGKTYAEIEKIDPVTGETLMKRVSTDTLREWRVAPKEVGKSSNENLIDKVPKSADEARGALDARREKELEAKYADRLNELNTRLNELTEGINVEDMLNLRGYLSGVENIRKGWEMRGEGGIDYSSIGEEAKQKFYNQMSPDAQKIASTWANTYLDYENVQRLINS